MKFDVLFKFCPFFELPLAELAFVKRLLVYTPHMAVQITFWSKQRRAKVALVGFLTRVDPHVHFESRCCCTLLGAELARKLVLPSVHKDVIVVLGLLGKPERTVLTLERAQVWPPTLYIIILHRAHSGTFEFSLLAHILQMLLAIKINSHISSNFCPDPPPILKIWTKVWRNMGVYLAS